jgi:trigger factor
MAHSHDHHHGHDHPGLDVQVERTGPCLATVRFQVTAEEFKRSRAEGLRNYASRTRLKGFRPGKVPIQMIEKQFGPEVDRALVEHFVQHALDHAVREESLRLAASPRIELESVQTSSEEDWGHEFEVLLRPDIELGQVEGLAVEGQPISIDEEEIDGTLERVRREMSHPEPVEEAGLPADGMAVCKVAFLAQDQEEPLLERDGIRLGPKTALRGIDEAAFEEALTGAQPEDVHDLPMEFPEDFPVEEARGTQGTCRITVDQAFRIVPPEEERVLEEFGVEDEAGLRTEVEKRIRTAKGDQEAQRIEHVLLEQLLEAHPMEVPEPLVEDQARAKVEELRQALAGQGVEGEELETRLTQEHQAAFQGAARAMRAIYLMETIAKEKDLQVGEADLEAELAAIAARNGVPADEVRKYYREESLLQQLALELLERKVRSFLRESADITLADAAD